MNDFEQSNPRPRNQGGRPLAVPGERRKPKSVSLTDSEWASLKARAKAAGISVSDLVRTLIDGEG